MLRSLSPWGVRSAVCLVLLTAIGHAYAVPEANTLPSGENVVKGSASFNRSIANRLIVTQTSDRLITNWNSFDIGSDARVSFKQPDSNSIALNRVTSGNPTEIFGAINANGQFFIINPNGITFGAGSQLRAASIVASVLDVNDHYFYTEPGVGLYGGNNERGGIENQGTLISNNGSVILVASTVKNSGRIKATGGNTILANAGSAVLYPTEHQSFLGSYQTGIIQNSGIIQASKFESKGGKVLLKADNLQHQNEVELSGRILSTDGLEVIGKKIHIGRLSSDNNSSFIAQEINFNNIFNLEGANSQLILKNESNQSFNYYLSSDAKINIKGDNSYFEVQGTHVELIRNIEDLYRLSDSNSFVWQYALTTDIDASTFSVLPGTPGFKPIGSSTTPFNGTFDGLGHTIRGLRIQQPRDYAAFFGYTGHRAKISNLNLINVNISGFAAAGLVYHNFGGTLSNNQVTGNISARITDYDDWLVNHKVSLAAGMVGINEHGNLHNNRVNVKVSSSGHTDRTWVVPTGTVGQAGLAGGLIAINSQGNIVSNTVAGTVTGQYKVGGLIGENDYTYYNNTSSAHVVGIQPLNAVSPRGFIGLLIGDDTGNSFNNISTGTVTLK